MKATQLKLDLFPKKKLPNFELFTWYMDSSEKNEFTDTGYNAYIGRKTNEENGKQETFAILSSLNFLGKQSGTSFRFMTYRAKEACFRFHNDVVLPELGELTLDEIKVFLKRVVENISKGYYAWDYEHRCHIFTLPSNPELAIDRYTSFQGDLYQKTMIANLGKDKYWELMINRMVKVDTVLN